MARIHGISQRIKRRPLPRPQKPGGSVILAHSDTRERTAVAFVLMHLGYEIHEADTGGAVLQLLNAAEFPLLMIESGLDGENQMARVGALREEGVLSRRMPVVFISPTDDPRASRRVRRVLPHTGVLRPPYNETRIREAIARAMRLGAGSARQSNRSRTRG